jgi:hypothetical protein
VRLGPGQVGAVVDHVFGIGLGEEHAAGLGAALAIV